MTLQFHIPDPSSPYRFDILIDILSRFAHPSLNIVRDNAVLRVLRQPEGLALISVTAGDDGVDVTIVSQTGVIDEAYLQQQTAHFLGLNRDDSLFYQFAESDEKLRTILDPVWGVPIWCAEDVFEAVIFLIIEQHISWVAAQKAQRTLVEWCDEGIEYQGQRYYAMPSPQRLAQAAQDDLRPLKITFKRMQLLIDLAQQFQENPIYETSSTDLYKSLLAIKGIGHWTAANVVHRALGVYPYVLHNDVAVQAALNFYMRGQEGRIDKQTMFDLLEPYGEWQGFVAHLVLMRWVLDRYPVNTQS